MDYLTDVLPLGRHFGPWSPPRSTVLALSSTRNDKDIPVVTDPPDRDHRSTIGTLTDLGRGEKDSEEGGPKDVDIRVMYRVVVKQERRGSSDLFSESSHAHASLDTDILLLRTEVPDRTPTFLYQM